MVKTIVLPLIIIIILVILICLLLIDYKRDHKDFKTVIAALIAVVAIAEGSSVYEFLIEIPSLFFGSNRQIIDFPEDCDRGNILVYEGHTYVICETRKINDFWDAEKLCEDKDGHLAVINSENENKRLYDYFIRRLGKKSAYFGYTDANSEGNWYWVDGSSSKEDGGYENFYEKPNNLNEAEHYALFWYKDPVYTWNDGDFGKDSDGKVYFIIEWDYVDESLVLSRKLTVLL